MGAMASSTKIYRRRQHPPTLVTIATLLLLLLPTNDVVTAFLFPSSYLQIRPLAHESVSAGETTTTTSPGTAILIASKQMILPPLTPWNKGRQPLLNTPKISSSLFSSSSSSTDGSDPSSSSSDTTTAATTTSSSPPDDNNIQKTTDDRNIRGIGGKDGITYNVNALKRNLVQEAVRETKSELLRLLLGVHQTVRVATSGVDGDDEGSADDEPLASPRRLVPRGKRRGDLIEEKLSSLLQINPVKTTTDSNLLDGVWSFAFSSGGTAEELLDPTRFEFPWNEEDNGVGGVGKEGMDQKEGGDEEEDITETVGVVIGERRNTKSGMTEGPFRSSSRCIYLENLDDEEDAYVVDRRRYLGGLVGFERWYDVTGLSRQSLDLEVTRSRVTLLRFVPITYRGRLRKGRKPMEERMQVLYLDSDLCISTTGQDMTSPVQVYTKNDAWISGRASLRRKVRFLLDKAVQIPKRLRPSGPDQEEEENWIILRRRYNDDIQSKLTVLKLGEAEEDGTIRVDPSWDVEEDPFADLSSLERQNTIKQMSIVEIEELWRKQKVKNEKERKIRYRTQKQFKKPEAGDEEEDKIEEGR